MTVINERFWVFLVIMMVLPLVLIMILPSPYGSIATIGSSLVMVLYFRRFTKNIASNLFGGKLKYSCLVCQGMKFDSKGTCVRCGGKARRPV